MGEEIHYNTKYHSKLHATSVYHCSTKTDSTVTTQQNHNTASSPQASVRVTLVKRLKTVHGRLARHYYRQLAREVFAGTVGTVIGTNH